jgi:hypothetical protein
MEKHSALQKHSGTFNVIAMVVAAKNEMRIYEAGTEKIKEIIRYLLVMIGFPPEKYPDKTEILVLVDYMMKELRSFSLMDVKIAFTLYVQQRLDFKGSHYNKFSILFLENIMQSYNRYRVNLNIKNDTPVDQPEPDAEQIEQINREATLLKFKNYIETGTISDPGNASYNWLDKKGFIRFSIERKKAIFEEAKKQAISEKSSQLGKELLHEGNNVKQIKKEISAIRENGDPAVIAAKKMALKEYFNDLIEIDARLDEILDEGELEVSTSW